VPPAVRSIELVDLMGNRTVHRVHGGKLRIRVLGAVTFLHADPPDALTEVVVRRARRAPRR